MKLCHLTPLIVLLAISIQAPGQQNDNGISTSAGQHHKGSLKNGRRIPRKGTNFKYFSRLSYYILGSAHVHAKVHATVLDSYKNLEQKYPGRKFRIMECSKKKGGKMLLHRTHQNGLSIDFMTPLLSGNKKQKHYDRLGILRYTLDFDEEGKRNSKVCIDFNTMAEHLLALEKHARRNGLKIKKVIFKIELKDDLFATEAGKKLKAKGIYFARILTPVLNKVHDDHYHVDFELLN